MAWGLFDNRFNYAAASSMEHVTVTSMQMTSRISPVSSISGPFATWTDHWLENFNIGGSTDTGLEQNILIPQVFRTNVATTGNLAIGPEFLALNKNVNESGLGNLLVAAYGVLLPTFSLDRRMAERLR